MKLTSLTLHRFRASTALTFNLDAPRILVAGVNGTGKSSIKEALQWALLGACTGTDARGSGWEALAPDGLELSVSLLSPELVLHRKYVGSSRALAVHGVTGEGGIHQQAIFARLNTTPARLAAVLETSNFLRLHHGEAKALMLDLLDVIVTIDGEELRLDQVDSRHTVAFEERKVAKVRLRGHTIPPLPLETFPAVSAIDAQLQKLRTETSEWSTRVGAVAGQRQLLERQLADARRLEIVPSAPDAAEMADLERRLAVERTVVPLTVVASDLSPSQIRQRIDALRGHKPTKGCVLDPDVPCETAKARFTNRAKSMEELLQMAQPALQSLQDERQSLERRLTALRSLQDSIAGIEARNAVRLADAERLQAELGALPEDTEATTALEALQARIRKGELLRDRAAAYWQAMARREQAIQDHQKLEAEVERLEALCQLLGPNGARVEALTAAIGAFEAKVNAFTQPFGWTITFRLDPWMVLANGRPVETYSESEQFRVGIALQLAIAELSGLSFAVIDRLDLLDVANRKLVSKMIAEAPIQQIILLATREPEQALPQTAGLLSYRLGSDKGRTIVLEAPEAVHAAV